MKFKRHTEVLAGRPDVVPFINVTLLLLLFFLVATRFVQEPGVSIQLPLLSGSPSPVSLQPPLVITVSAQNPDTRVNNIFFNDQIVSLSRLGPLLAEAANRFPYRDCVIKADRNAPHGLVVAILGLAQQAGFRTVRIATQVPEEMTAPRTP